MKKILLLLLMCSLASWQTGSVLAQANVQAAYAGTDPSVPAIDVYFSLAGIPLGVERDIEGGEGTALLNVPGVLTVTARIVASPSNSSADAFASFTLSFTGGTTTTGIVSGVLDLSQFAPNPDGRNIGVDLFLFDQSQTMGTSPDALDLAFFHGVTDAPALDVRIRGEALVANASYGDFAAYTPLMPGTYIFDVAEAATGTIFASFLAEVTTEMAGQAAIVGLLGFRDPSVNQNGDALKMTALFASGTSVDLPATTLPIGVEQVAGQLPETPVLDQNYPNPFSASSTINFEIPTASFVQMDVYNILGKHIATLVKQDLTPGHYTADFDGSEFLPGVYVAVLRAGDVQTTRRMVLVR